MAPNDEEIITLTTELRGLSSGKGIEDPNITKRIRPMLRRVCGIPDEAGPERARELLVERLRELLPVLDSDQQKVVGAAFPLYEIWRAPFKNQRIAKILPELEVAERTAIRWLDEACERLAQAALNQPAAPSAGAATSSSPWHTKSVEVAVVLDLATPEIHEHRTIVANQDGLSEVELSLTWALVDGKFAQADLDGLTVDVLYGGTVVTTILQSDRRVGFTLKLPRPLGRNKEHEYAFRIKLAPHHPIEPFYVCTPRYPCESFRMHVRFGADKVPHSLWKIHRTLPSEIGDSVIAREAASVDSCGEAHIDFLDLEPNLSYGLRWSFTAAEAAGGPGPC